MNRLRSYPGYCRYSCSEHWVTCIFSNYVFFQIYFSRASLVAQLVKNLPAMRETWVWSLVGKIPWRMEQLPTPVFWPEDFHGLYSPWCCKELDTTEWLSLSLSSCMLNSGNAGSYGSSIFSFFRNLHTVLHSDCTMYILTNTMDGRIPFSLHPLQHVLFIDFFWSWPLYSVLGDTSW